MKTYDEHGKEIISSGGTTELINPSINDYFLSQYEKQDWRVSHGNWPPMLTKDDVDKWIFHMNAIMTFAFSDK